MDVFTNGTLAPDEAVSLAAKILSEHLNPPIGIKELYTLIPYVVTLLVLIVVSLRKKREDQPPMSLGLPYFREER